MQSETLSTEQYKNDFGDILRNLRNKNRISAREMSLSLGQNVNYINLIENGKRLPSMQGFFSICEYMKITPADFFAAGVSENVFTDHTLLTLFSQLSVSQKKSLINLIRNFTKQD